MLTSIATSCAALGLVLQQSRVFLNRYGERIYEEILHFRPASEPARSQEEAVLAARSIARQVLDDARGRAPDPEVLADLDEAIQRTSDVEPSPILSLAGQPSLLSRLHNRSDAIERSPL
jgi:hypothetical protein